MSWERLSTNAEREELVMTEKPRTASSANAMKFWVLVQHDEVSVLHQAERPNGKAEPGERMKQVLGPFANKEDAKEKADWYYSRTLKAKVERAG